MIEKPSDEVKAKSEPKSKGKGKAQTQSKGSGKHDTRRPRGQADSSHYQGGVLQFIVKAQSHKP